MKSLSHLWEEALSFGEAVSLGGEAALRRALQLGKLLLVGAFTLCLPIAVQAHQGHRLLRAERYLKLDVSGHRGRLVISLSLGAEAGQALLEEVDIDRDGQVSEAEAGAYLERWAQTLRQELPLRREGQALSVSYEDGYLSPLGATHSEDAERVVTVEQIAHFELPPGLSQVEFDDGMDRDPYDRTDVAFRAHEGAEILAHGFEGDVHPAGADLVYGSGLRPGRVLTMVARLQIPEREFDNTPDGESTELLIYALPPAALLLLALLFLALRRTIRAQ